MTLARRLALQCGLVVMVIAAAPAGRPGMVVLKPGAAQQLGIATMVLADGSEAGPARRLGVATVLDSMPFLQLVDDSAAAGATAAASAADAARQAALFAGHQDVSQRAVEVAHAQAAADRARARTATSRFVVEWSPALASPPAALIAGLRSGKTRLVRIESLSESTQLRHGQRLSITAARTALPLRAVVIGSASGPSAVAGGPAWLAYTNAPALHTLETLDVAVPGAAAGVMVPASAVVMLGGKPWLFRVIPGSRFERVALPPAEAVPGGFRVAAGLPAGTRIVERGAGALLSVAASVSPKAD